MEKIKVFKMINGEELIGEIFNNFADYIELKAPAQIVMQQTKEGLGVAMAPYMPYATGNIELHKHAIASSGVPDMNMQNEYNRIFGSGIQIAPASALSGLQMP
jgi:hypothetical protein